MEIRQLTKEDAEQFSNLILDMYAHLDSIEWFSPMPFRKEDVEGMIEKTRLYILGAFDGDFLCAVGSLDYKCGKLIGKVDFPKEVNTDKLVEFGFAIVHSSYRGQGIMKQLIDRLIVVSKEQGFEWGFGKAHKDNLASSTSLKRKGFERVMDYNKPVKVESLQQILADNILSAKATKYIKKRLKENKDPEFLYMDYDILMKKL